MPSYTKKRAQSGSALLELMIIAPIILIFLAGLYALGNLAVTSIHLTHAARSAAREYMINQDIRLCRAFIYKSIDRGGSPLEISRLKVYLGDRREQLLSPDKKKKESLVKKLLKGVFKTVAGTKITVSYRWPGLRLFGLELAPVMLYEDCTVLVGSWSLCSD